MAVTVDTVVLVNGSLQIRSSTCKALHGNPACGAGRTQGQEWELHHVPTHAAQTPRLFSQPVPPPCRQGTPNLTLALMPASQVVDQKLSGQRAALERGQNPLPLFLSLSVKQNDLQTLDFKGTVLSPVHCVLQHTHTHTHTLMMHRWPTSWKDGGVDGLMGQAAGLSVWGKGCGV